MEFSVLKEKVLLVDPSEIVLLKEVKTCLTSVCFPLFCKFSSIGLPCRKLTIFPMSLPPGSPAPLDGPKDSRNTASQ